MCIDGSCKRVQTTPGQYQKAAESLPMESLRKLLAMPELPPLSRRIIVRVQLIRIISHKSYRVRRAIKGLERWADKIDPAGHGERY